VLRNVHQGELTVEDIDGQITVCGKPVEGCPVTRLTVHKETFWVRMMLFADMVRFQTLA